MINSYVNKTDKTTAIETRTLGEASVSLFPNPAIDNVTLTMEAGQEDLLTVDIFDLTGRMVKRIADAMPTVTGENNLHIGVSDLSEGTYLLAVSNRIGEKAVIKFIKK